MKYLLVSLLSIFMLSAYAQQGSSNSTSEQQKKINDKGISQLKNFPTHPVAIKKVVLHWTKRESAEL